VKSAVVVAALLCACQIAAAQDSPPRLPQPAKPVRTAPKPVMPLAIPDELAPPQETFAAFPEEPSTPPAQPTVSACQTRLAAIASFKPLPTLVGPGECGATDAVLLETVILFDRSKVTLSPPATLRCPMAEQLAYWVRDDVVPSVKRFGAALRGLDNYDSYECRGRNRVRGATLSEHGRANAIDIRGVKLANGKTMGLTDINVDKAWREAMKATGCARFSTVLGPGSDGYHEEHIHFDLAERRSSFKFCHWDVREPVVEVKAQDEGDGDAAPAQSDEPVPLPRPRPVAKALK
jgi:hypothetical protein